MYLYSKFISISINPYDLDDMTTTHEKIRHAVLGEMPSRGKCRHGENAVTGKMPSRGKLSLGLHELSAVSIPAEGQGDVNDSKQVQKPLGG